MLAEVHYFFCLFIAAIGSVWILGSITAPFQFWRRSIGVRLVALLAGFLMGCGALGFFGAGLAAGGGLNWLPPSFEWPVGNADGIVTTKSGLQIVPLIPQGRVQVYDANWHFVRGWGVGTVGKHFKVRVMPGNEIEVVGGRVREVYTIDGKLIQSEPEQTADDYNAMPDGRSHRVPTPIYLWSFTGPFQSWATAGAGMGLLILCGKRVKARTVA